MTVGDLRRLILPLTDECRVKLRLLPGGGDVFIGEHAPVDEDQSGIFFFDGEGMLLLVQGRIAPALGLDEAIRQINELGENQS